MTRPRSPRALRKALRRNAASPRPDRSPTVNMTDSDLRTMHSLFIDSITMQAPEVARALLLHAGLSSGTFLTNLATGVMRLRPSIDDEGEPAIALEVWDSEGYSTLVIVRAALLDVDVEELGRAWSEGMDAGLRGIVGEPEA